MCEWEDQAPNTTTQWLAVRQENTRSPLSDWEHDDMFVAFALIKWPKDMVLVSFGGYKSQGPRTRLRHRHEAFEALWETMNPPKAEDGAQQI